MNGFTDMETTARPQLTLSDLPNELLLDILSVLPTRDLIRATLYSHHFHHLAVRILEQRISTAASHAADSILLECHRPSLKYSEPPLYCTYLGTDGLDVFPASSTAPASRHACDDHVSPGTRLSELNNMYARFRPFRYQHQVDRLRARRFAGDVRGSRTHPDTNDSATNSRSATPSPTRHVAVRQTLHLDSFELFTQLCASTALVLANGPLGFIHSSVPLSNGIIRVWRRFLAEAHKASNCSGEGKVETPLWVNDGENVGVMFTVRKLGEDVNADEGKDVDDDDEEPVSYEIRYDELHVKSLHLLLAVEKSMQLADERDAREGGLSGVGMAAGMDAGLRGTVLFNTELANAAVGATGLVRTS